MAEQRFPTPFQDSASELVAKTQPLFLALKKVRIRALSLGITFTAGLTTILYVSREAGFAAVENPYIATGLALVPAIFGLAKYIDFLGKTRSLTNDFTELKIAAKEKDEMLEKELKRLKLF